MSDIVHLNSMYNIPHTLKGRKIIEFCNRMTCKRSSHRNGKDIYDRKRDIDMNTEI